MQRSVRPAPRGRDGIVCARALQVRLSGTELFSQVRDAGLEGVVFNPAGPSGPFALASAIATPVLEGE